MPRKELHADCDGGIFCPVAGHTETVSRGVGRYLHRHVPLTPGQKRTLYERRAAARAQPGGSE